MMKNFSEKNPLDGMMHGSPFISSEPIVYEMARSFTSKEYDSEEFLHFCEDERSSSLLTEFEAFPTGPECVVLNHIPDSTLIFHDKSLEMENPWAKEFYEAMTLESKGKDSTDEHGSFILEIPQEPCSSNASPESGMLCAPSIDENYNYLKVLSCKMFRRLVVDSYVYHKHCKFRGCTVALILQLKLHDTSIIGGARGTTSLMIVARRNSHGRHYDHK